MSGFKEDQRASEAVEVWDPVWIPMRDGKRLAGRVWVPKERRQPLPAILEYIPYRLRDHTAVRDSTMHPYMASRGYACVRVDLRGSGNSEGVLLDEYLPEELEDGLEVLRWLGRQEWCSGSVGMIGISWGGFNGLQLAAMRPPELKAVITVCSTDDRYTDDVHYMGGCLLGDNLSWASNMFSYNSLPPDPEVVGERWREMWLERLEALRPWVIPWLEHPYRDEYWRHGSICEDLSAVQCPVFAVSGWADGYSNAVFRLVTGLQVPRKGLIGPWGHKYPHLGMPGPAIGFLQEAVRWWDRWLKGEENGVMDEPRLQVWMQESVPPSVHCAVRPGRWVGESCWPSDNVKKWMLKLAPARLVGLEEDVREDFASLQSPLSVGLFAGRWCSFSATPDLPHDQREEDGGALIYETDALEEEVEILGAPVVDLEFEVNRPTAMLCARLSDVRRDGRATRVTYGLLNLTHRNSNEEPEYLEPGRRYRCRVAMNEIAQSVPAGHRIRVSLSTSYWPVAWPAPESVQARIYNGGSVLELPVRKGSRQDEGLGRFGEPVGTPPTAVTVIEPRNYQWLVKRDLAADISTLEVVKDEGRVKLEAIDLEMRRKTTEWYSYQGDDFGTVRGETLSVRGFRRGTWQVETVTRTVLTSGPEKFRVRANLDAYEGDGRVFCRSWDEDVARRFI